MGPETYYRLTFAIEFMANQIFRFVIEIRMCSTFLGIL